MKLQLKHLDFVNNGKVRLFNNLILYSKDVNLQDCKLGFDGNKQPYLMHENIPYYLDEIKPYKRNLNQLTQEIEHDGVRFVPIVELLKLKHKAWNDEKIGTRYAEIEFEETPNQVKAYYSFHALNEIRIWKKSLELEEFWIIQKLQEWHFAIDIPSELYIEMEAIPTTKPNTA